MFVAARFISAQFTLRQLEDAMEEFSAIRGFFSDSSWHELSDCEKRRFCNMKTNYEKMSELGKYLPTFPLKLSDSITV